MPKNRRQGANAPMFSSPDGWRADPIKAFEDWAVNARRPNPQGQEGESARPLFRGSSIKVYTAMWASFVRSAQSRQVDPFSMAADDIARFLLEEKSGIGHQHRRRYARVIARALAHAREEPEAARKPRLGRPAAKADDEPTPFLDAQERGKVMDLLSGAAMFDSPAQIARSRSMAICALLLGGGLKPGEALKCSSVNCALIPGEDSIRLDLSGAPKGRVAHFDPRAKPALRAWMEWRESEGGPALLFPSQGGAGKATVDYARAFTGVKRLLAEAGIAADGERASPQTLRNSYGAALIEAGKPEEVVRSHMGFTRLEFARRFIAAHARWTKRREEAAPGLAEASGPG